MLSEARKRQNIGNGDAVLARSRAPHGACAGKRENERLVNDMTTSTFSVVVSRKVAFPHLAYRSGSLVNRANNTAARWAGPAAVRGTWIGGAPVDVGFCGRSSPPRYVALTNFAI